MPPMTLNAPIMMARTPANVTKALRGVVVTESAILPPSYEHEDRKWEHGDGRGNRDPRIVVTCGRAGRARADREPDLTRDAPRTIDDRARRRWSEGRDRG